MGLAATTPEALSELFVSTIVGLTPRIAYKGGEAWKPYTRETANASATRRFRLVWNLGNTGLQPGGAMGGRKIEAVAEMRVRVEYAGSNPKWQFALDDDFWHLQDSLSALKSDDANGLILVRGIRYEPAVEVDASAPIAIDSTDVARYDLVYEVRYMRSTSP